MYVLTEWEGRTGKYLARSHNLQTERSQMRVSWLGAKYFLVRPPYSVNKHFFIWPLTVENFENRTRWTSARGTTQKKDSTIKKLLLCHFRVRTRNYYASKNATFFTLFFYSFKFLNAELDGFFRTGSRQPVRPYTRQFLLWFSIALCERSLTGHMII